MTCLYPAYAIGIRAHRWHQTDQFAQPRCCATAMHGIAIGEWEYRTVDGRLRKITHWERITP